MFAINFMNYLRGCLKIKIKGNFPERFINVCIKKDINLFEISRKGDKVITCYILAKDFLKIRKLARNTHNKVRILKKCGLYFFIRNYKKRNIVLIGIFGFCLILWYCMNFVTGIEIKGENIDKATIISDLRDFGIQRGKKISKIDVSDVENQIITKREDIAWIGINLSGSKVVVEVRERKKSVDLIDEKTPTNIIALKSGLIEKMEVRSGESVVKEGCVVQKGDLLVSGIINGQNNVKLVHSFGDIYARVWYKKSEDFPLFYEKRIKTPKTKNRFEVIIFKKPIRLYLNSRIPFTYYDKKEETKNIKIFGKAIPIKFKKITFFEEVVTKKTRDANETIAFGIDKLKKELQKEIPPNAQIRNFSKEIKTSNESEDPKDSTVITVSIEYECSENIGMTTILE